MTSTVRVILDADQLHGLDHAEGEIEVTVPDSDTGHEDIVVVRRCLGYWAAIFGDLRACSTYSAQQALDRLLFNGTGCYYEERGCPPNDGVFHARPIH